MTNTQKRLLILFFVLIGFVIIVGLWEPHALIFGLQRGSLYALIALPLALLLGIMDILNLAHGEFLTVGLYISYLLFVNLGVDPLVSAIPVFFLLVIIGGIIYQIAVKRVLGAGHLNQLLLTFGISMVLIEIVKIIWTTRPLNVYVPYASSAVTFGDFRIGSYEFIYVILAAMVFILLKLFLKKTRLGQAIYAVGQNPKGAEIVGINVKFVYFFVFCLSIGLLGIFAAVMLPRFSIFPLTGNPFSLKSFALVAMAGLGNIGGIMIAGITLGIGEAVIQAVPGYGGWSDLVFFGVLIVVIMAKNFQEVK
ncbi:MAG: branched-chain amino acid ABC transporter permease [Bacillota bacterium]